MAETYCSMCKGEFQDEEIVALSKDGAYHHIVQDLIAIPMDCAMKKSMQGVSIFGRRVYYEGKFYDLNKLGKLSNSNELTIEFNKARSGDIIKGDLKGLNKKLFGIF